MFPKRQNMLSLSRTLSKQRGSTTIVAIIISIVLLGLGIALSNQISSNIRQQSIEYYGARAYLAAQSGVEMMVSRLVELNDPLCPNEYVLPLQSTVSFPNCVISVKCQDALDVIEPDVASEKIDVYEFTATASCSSGQINTSRRVTVEVRQEQ
ncbi:agglutinin biogenesis protein MshP [Alteromonas macleodii]|uniref:Agglutinin biogenesis protein MshP n=2 Tax=Alteromonas macleodii TaxID=28108 RepID=A0A6T9XVN5_ALTMA|nr:agglutinin biogenesis protein MshP [Alteromonas macleodii]CAB9492303.1 Agglutinin biogenesis protein MshP [Alteromonas macleodii]